MMTIWASSATAADLPIIVYWSFDSDQGKTFLHDRSSNKFDMQLVPVNTDEKVKTVNGIIGQALEFTGQEKSIFKITDIRLNLKVPFTIACWVKIKNKEQANNSIFCHAWDTGKDGYRLYVSWRMFSYCWGDGTKMNSIWTERGSVLLDRWYHLAVTNNGKVINLYINGSLAKSVTGQDLQPATNSESCGIGNYFDTKNYRFAGLMDEFYILGKALSEDEVFDLAAKQDDETSNKK
jgi:hypothetical protein